MASSDTIQIICKLYRNETVIIFLMKTNHCDDKRVNVTCHKVDVIVMSCNECNGNLKYVNDIYNENQQQHQ